MTHLTLRHRPATRLRAGLTTSALALAAACGPSRDASADAALNNDLALAGRAPVPQQQVVSPQELTPGQTAPAAYAPGTVGPNGAPAAAYAPPATRVIERERVVYRDRPARRRASSGGYSSGTDGSGETVVREEPRTVRKSNTKTGAIVGSAAGAAIGVATSRDKLKGGLLGAVLGGAAGAVIGNNTGVKHVPAP